MRKIIMVVLLLFMLLMLVCLIIKVVQFDLLDLLKICDDMKLFWVRYFDYDKQYYICIIFEVVNGGENFVDVIIIVNKGDVSIFCNVFWLLNFVRLKFLGKKVFRDIKGFI